MFRLLQYSAVAVAVFLQLYCYFCVLQNPCLGYKLQQKEQTLPPVSICKLFKLLLARPFKLFLAQEKECIKRSVMTEWDFWTISAIVICYILLELSDTCFLYIEAQIPSFRKVKCRFGQGKGGGNYTSVSYLEFPSLPSPHNVLLQTLSPLPPQPLALEHPQVQPSPPGCLSLHLYASCAC